MGQSAQVGFNNNVRHKGRRFHVQTEDSGIAHPHIITHLFVDGGRIVKSVKTSYAARIGEERLHETVRQLMKEQHKNMLIRLRDGEFDFVFEDAQSTQAAPEPTTPSQDNSAEGSPVREAPAAPSEPLPESTAPSTKRSAEPPAPRPRMQSYEDLPPLPPPIQGSVSPAAVRHSTPAAGRYDMREVPAEEVMVTPRTQRTPRPTFGAPVSAPESERSLDALILSYLKDDLDD
jgi:hypothetical protein